MDIKKYIASGILEQYVLGNLSPVEQGEVEQYAVEYPEIADEIEAIEEALELYSQANAVQPRPGLESQILDKISDKTPILNELTPAKEGASIFNLLTGIAIAATLAAVVWGLSLSTKLSESENQLAQLQTQYEQLETNCNEQLEQKEQTEQWFAFLKNDQTNAVEMTGVPEKQPDATAIVYQNPSLNKSYLEVVSMPQLPTDKQYQLWAIVGGQPVDMGVFDVVVSGDSSFIEVPFIANAQAYAVTIEKAGGSQSPTLEEMVVIGNAG